MWIRTQSWSVGAAVPLRRALHAEVRSFCADVSLHTQVTSYTTKILLLFRVHDPLTSQPAQAFASMCKATGAYRRTSGPRYDAADIGCEAI